MTTTTQSSAPPTYEYEAELVRVVDGDTIILRLHKDFMFPVDFGFNISDEVHLHKSSVQTFRLLGINTPEVVGEEKVKGLQAKEALVRFIENATLRVVSHGKDKYGRWLGTLYMKPVGTNGNVPIPEVNVNDWLISEGLAVPYMV